MPAGPGYPPQATAATGGHPAAGYPPQQPASKYPTQAAPPAGAYPAVVQTVAAGQFDAGARFKPYAPGSVPPPPPGYAPNAAQMAAAQGQNVAVEQKKGGFFKGTGSGGFTFW